MSTGDGARAQRRALFVALFTVFLDILAFGVIIPIQPFYAESFGASEAVVTLLGASFSFMQFLFAPMWGALSDRIGRRPVMLVSVTVAMFGHVLMASATALWVLFAARVVVGIGSSNFGAAQAVVADTTSGPARSKGMGLIGAAFGVGFILGPAIGGTLVQLGPTIPMWFSAALSLANLLFAWRYLPETHPPERRRHRATDRRWLPLLELPRARHFPNARLLLLVSALAVTAQGLSEQVLSLLIERVWVTPELGLGTVAAHKRAAALTAICLIGVGLTAVVVQGGLLGRLQRRYGERALIHSGAIIAALGILGFPLSAAAGSFALLILAGVFFAAGVGLVAPSVSGFLSRSVPHAEQGQWLGMAQSLGALGRAVGPALSGLLFTAGRAFPFAVGAGLMLLAWALGLRLGQPNDHRAS
jgi:MFS family permease